MIQWIDTHAHLAMLEHAPLETILERCKHAGISQMLSVSTEKPDWDRNRELAEKLDHVYYSLGIHPHHAKHWPQWGKDLFSHFINDIPPMKCVAIGETGLDFHYNLSPREIQISNFENHIALAKTTSLPLIIHCRDAFEEVFGCLENAGVGTYSGVMHCFTGNSDQALRAIELGLKISFSGILTFKNAVTIQEAAKIIPNEVLLLETDCPYLSPIPHRGEPNEPSFLPQTGRMLAQLRGVSEATIAEQTSINAKILFGLP